MTDFLLDPNSFDLLWRDGDLVAGPCERQNQQLLVLVEKGELREFPTRGVGAQSWLLDDAAFGDFNAAVKQQFELDGMRVLQVRGSGFNLQIEASYE
jgi:hypothetical protein